MPRKTKQPQKNNSSFIQFLSDLERSSSSSIALNSLENDYIALLDAPLNVKKVPSHLVSPLNKKYKENNTKNATRKTRAQRKKTTTSDSLNSKIDSSLNMLLMTTVLITVGLAFGHYFGSTQKCKQQSQFGMQTSLFNKYVKTAVATYKKLTSENTKLKEKVKALEEELMILKGCKYGVTDNNEYSGIKEMFQEARKVVWDIDDGTDSDFEIIPGMHDTEQKEIKLDDTVATENNKTDDNMKFVLVTKVNKKQKLFEVPEKNKTSVRDNSTQIYEVKVQNLIELFEEKKQDGVSYPEEFFTRLPKGHMLVYTKEGKFEHMANPDGTEFKDPLLNYWFNDVIQTNVLNEYQQNNSFNLTNIDFDTVADNVPDSSIEVVEEIDYFTDNNQEVCYKNSTSLFSNNQDYSVEINGNTYFLDEFLDDKKSDSIKRKSKSRSNEKRHKRRKNKCHSNGTKNIDLLEDI